MKLTEYLEKSGETYDSYLARKKREEQGKTTLSDYLTKARVEVATTDISDIYDNLNKGGYIDRATLSSYKSRLDDYTNKYSKIYDSKNEDAQSYLDNLKQLQEGVNKYNDYAFSFDSDKAYEDYYKRTQLGQDLYDQATSAEDYKQYADIGASIENGEYGTLSGVLKGINNKAKYYRDNSAAISANSLRSGVEDPNLIYTELKDEEYNVYNYWLAKENEGTVEKGTAQSYLDAMEETLKQRRAGEIADNANGNLGLSLAFGVSAGLSQFANGAYNFFNFSSDYIAPTVTDYASQQIRENLKDTGNQFLGSSWGQIAYDTVTTTANMLPTIMVSSLIGGTAGAIAGNAAMGLSAAGNEYQQLLAEGMSKGKARALSTALGVWEGASEYYLGSIENLAGNKLSKLADKTILKNLKSSASGMVRGIMRAFDTIVIDPAQEGFEEVIQDIGSTIIKGVMTGEWDKLDFQEEAYSFTLGALSAFAMNSATGSIGNTVNDINTYRHGKSIIKMDGVDALSNLAKETASEYNGNDILYKYADNVAKKPTAMNVGILSQNVNEARNENNRKSIENSLIEQMVKDGVKIKEARKKASKLAETLLQEYNGEEINLEKALKNPSVKKVYDSVIKNEDSEIALRDENHAEVRQGIRQDYIKREIEKAELNKSLSEKYSYSDDGKTFNTKTGEDVVLASKDVVSSNENGNLILKTDSGETVNASDLSFASEGVSSLYSTIADMGVDAYIANSLIDLVPVTDSEQMIYTAKGISDAFWYGSNGVNYSELANSKLLTSALTEAQRKTAYNLGKIDAVQRMPKARTSIKKGTKYKGEYKIKDGKIEGAEFNNLNDQQRSGLDLAKFLSKLGANIYVFESTKEQRQNGKENGSYRAEDGSIHIDLNAGTKEGEGLVSYTVTHEFTHSIKEDSPALFKKYADLLFEALGKDGKSVTEMLHKELARLKRVDEYKNLSETKLREIAYEEVVAKCSEKMFTDTDALQRIADRIAKTDKTLLDKIIDFFTGLIERLRKAYSGQKANHLGNNAIDTIKRVEAIRDAFADAAVDALKNYRTATISETSSIEASKVEVKTDGAETTDGKTLFQYRAMEHDIPEYRKMLKTAGVEDTEIDRLFGIVDKVMEKVKENLEILDYDWELDIDDRAFNPVKPNSDSLYKYSIDFSTLCRKRILQQMVQMQLQEALDRAITREESIAIRNELMKIQQEGREIEVACALCYVESARMKSPVQIQKFIDNRRSIISEFFANKDTGNTKEKKAKAEIATRENLSKKYAEQIANEEYNDPAGYTVTAKGKKQYTPLKQLPDFMKKEIRNAKKKVSQNYVPTAEENKLLDIADKLSTSDFTSPEGLANLIKEYPRLFDAYTSYVRNATKSKGLEKDTWWRIGDSFKAGDDLIDAMNKENGLRSQSWSDFQVIHTLDYIAAIIELSTRGAKMQAYTKVKDYVKLMGNTNQMINLSLIPTAVFNGIIEYDSVEGMPFKTALELRDQYPATAGTICIGIDNKQIRMLLASELIDYVIPYHQSGMSKVLRKAMHIPTWTSYEQFQNESEVSDKAAEMLAKKYGAKLLSTSDPNWHKKVNFSDWFDLKEAQQIANHYNSMLDSELTEHEKQMKKQYGIMFGGYVAMQRMADNYKRVCAERGLSPKFSNYKADFSVEDNYWKLLIDRKMINNKTGEIIEQKAVKPVFNEKDVLQILNDEVARYPKVKEDQDYATKTVAQKFLSGEMDSEIKAIEKITGAVNNAVNNVAKVSILNSSNEVTKKSDRDSEYLELAKNPNKNEKRLRELVDYAAKNAGFDSPILYHGTQQFGFTKADVSFSDDGISFFATNKEQMSRTYSGNNGDVREISTKDETIKSYSPSDSKEAEKAEYILQDWYDLSEEERDEKYEEVEKELADYLYAMIEGTNATFGVQGYFDYNQHEIAENLLDYSTVFNAVDALYEKINEWQNAIDDEYGGNPGIYQLYANTDNMLVVDGKGKNWNTIDARDAFNGKAPNLNHLNSAKTRDIARIAKKLGYEGVIVKNITDNGGKSYDAGFGDVYIFFKPQSQVKSADLVTYDDNGNIIPISDRFNSKNDDIRYSDRVSNKELSEMDDTALYIKNTPKANYIGMIFNGTKTEETRSRRTLDEFIGKDFYVTDGKYVYGTVVFGEPHKYTEEEFHKKENQLKHRVPKGDEYDVKPGGIKWAYPIESYRKFSKPKKLSDSKEYKNSFQARQVLYSDRDVFGFTVDKNANVNESLLEELSIYDPSAKVDRNGNVTVYHRTSDQNAESIRRTGIMKSKEDALFFSSQPSGYADGYGDTVVALSIPSTVLEVNDIFDGEVHFDVPMKRTNGAWQLNVSKYIVEDSKFSDREDISNRTLLANALESVAQNDLEKNKLQQYKTKIGLMNADEKRLSEIKAKIKELSFAKGHRDAEQISKLQTSAKEIERRINNYDKQLFNLEASEPVKKVLAREYAKAKQVEAKRYRESLNAYKQRSAETVRTIIQKNQESRKKAVEGRNKTEVRNKVKKVVNELNTYLRDNKVLIGMQKVVAEALDAINMDTVGADERVAKYDELIAKTSDHDMIDELTKTRDRIAEQGEKLKDKLERLKTAYADIINSDDPLIANSHDEVIENQIAAVIQDVGNTSIRDMSLEQLEEVYEMYKMILTSIRQANKAFKMEKTESIAALGDAVRGQVKDVGGYHDREVAKLRWLKKFGWRSLKPIYAMRMIGSDTLTELYQNVRKGEDSWYVDMSDAKSFKHEQYKKHGYSDWDFKKEYEFTSKSGKTFKMSLDQIMSLYAYSKREQAIDHLVKGGIVFDSSIEVTEKKHGIPVKYNVNTATAFNLSEETIAQIIGTLSEEQKAFVDEMQAYLSEVMAEKGNEVSLALYGVKLFKEKVYFPLKSAKQFMYQQNEVAGEVRIKNSGFSKSTVAHANNPIIMSNFMDVWAGHCNDMSMYHSFTLALEDFNRVWNYKTRTDDKLETMSVKQTLQDAYGAGVNEYISTLLTDLNGGARQSGAEEIGKLMGLAKKGAVFASASVTIQQPSAICRAMAYINPKYFVKTVGKALNFKQHSTEWEECKKYAPIAGIKEMGYFDTGMGKSSVDWIKSEDYEGFRNKLNAFFKDGSYRDEVLSKAPSLADELTWTHIWNAVKAKVADTTNLTGEDLLVEAGKQFTEVITLTQVYDSVLSRSGLMRSKDTGMKMATAFMAEPTTTMNMVADAIVQGKRVGGKQGTKIVSSVVGSVTASIVLNSILKAVVVAWRHSDDDDEKSYIERYGQSALEDFIDNINPLTYIPFAKDIVSLFQGFDVSRMDMSLFEDFVNSIKAIDSSKKSAYDKVTGIIGSVSAFFGVPFKNIEKDLRPIIKKIIEAFN